MRYQKADNVLQLALDMQASYMGVSLLDIEGKYRVGRRTAQRMRDAVLRVFPQADEVETGERIKRWRIPAGVLNQLVAFTADELADLEAAIKLLRRENLEDHAASLEGLSLKLYALMRPDAARRVAPDLEALLEAEGLAMRPGPKPRLRPAVLEDLRTAIKAGYKVVIRHRNRSSGRLGRRTVAPYGFLYGNRHYLVAYAPRKGKPDYRLFSLSNIEQVDPTDEVFERDPEFSLEDYARRSFGVFQEEPVDVAWRFSPGAAENAREFEFHPDQVMEDQPDGSLVVRFRAGGQLEMAWHLYRWGTEVEVLEPASLARLCKGRRVEWPGLP